MQERFYQCGLSQENRQTVGFIEERGAKVGYHVEIPELGGFWKVLSVGVPVSKQEVHQLGNRARGSFTALKSYRGNK